MAIIDPCRAGRYLLGGTAEAGRLDHFWVGDRALWLALAFGQTASFPPVAPTSPVFLPHKLSSDTTPPTVELRSFGR